MGSDGAVMAGGRPSDYTQEKAALICERLGLGESLRAICRDEGMPAVGTVCRWLAAHKEFQEQYARAREAQADSIFDEILDIADDGRNDWMEINAEENAGWKQNGEALRRSQLRIDARKWMAGKLRPKKYGERVTTELSGPDGGAIKVEDDSPMGMARRIAFLLASGAADKPQP